MTTKPRPEQAPRIIPNRPKVKRGGHDACHNFEVYQFCHCMCDKCWSKVGQQCICLECNCRPRFD